MRSIIHPAPCKPRELLPASLLPYRQTWQPFVHALPTNAYVIVTDLDHQSQCALMMCLVQQRRRRGEWVDTVLAIYQERCNLTEESAGI